MAQNSFTPLTNTLTITACDMDAHKRVYCPTPTPTPTPTPEPIECDPSMPSYCSEVHCLPVDPNDCNRCWWNQPPGECGSPQAGCNCSPILLDIQDDGFHLTNASNGVEFDLNGDSTYQSRLGWTAPGSDDAWLALDRNANGIIDSGQELFGNFTPQPPGAVQHGFLALALFDQTQYGGNNNGRIDGQDTIYSSLKLWTDANHNGSSEQSELTSLASGNVYSIDLGFNEYKHRDGHGNWFKYRSKIRDQNGIHVGKWAWDVYLVHEPTSANIIPEYSTFRFKRTRCGELIAQAY